MKMLWCIILLVLLQNLNHLFKLWYWFVKKIDVCSCPSDCKEKSTYEAFEDFCFKDDWSIIYSCSKEWDYEKNKEVCDKCYELEKEINIKKYEDEDISFNYPQELWNIENIEKWENNFYEIKFDWESEEFKKLIKKWYWEKKKIKKYKASWTIQDLEIFIGYFNY